MGTASPKALSREHAWRVQEQEEAAGLQQLRVDGAEGPGWSGRQETGRADLGFIQSERTAVGQCPAHTGAALREGRGGQAQRAGLSAASATPASLEDPAPCSHCPPAGT